MELKVKAYNTLTNQLINSTKLETKQHSYTNGLEMNDKITKQNQSTNQLNEKN